MGKTTTQRIKSLKQRFTLIENELKIAKQQLEHICPVDAVVSLQGRAPEKFRQGQEVMVYDRYRFAIPLRAVIIQFAEMNDGVRLHLLQTNNSQYPIGCENVWVHQSQLRKVSPKSN
jgi:hypothetical protein